MASLQSVLADVSVSVSELKKNPSAILQEAGDEPVAILNHNRPVGYLISAERYERMLELLDDAALAQLVKERANGPFVDVTLNDL